VTWTAWSIPAITVLWVPGEIRVRRAWFPLNSAIVASVAKVCFDQHEKVRMYSNQARYRLAYFSFLLLYSSSDILSMDECMKFFSSTVSRIVSNTSHSGKISGTRLLDTVLWTCDTILSLSMFSVWDHSCAFNAFTRFFFFYFLPFYPYWLFWSVFFLFSCSFLPLLVVLVPDCIAVILEGFIILFFLQVYKQVLPVAQIQLQTYSCCIVYAFVPYFYTNR
jgi:hypothetical protein